MLEKLMNLLEDGKMIRANGCDMWLTPAKDYICWSHFGSSARRKSLYDLYWILNIIAGFRTGKIYENKTRSHYLPESELELEVVYETNGVR